MEVAQIIRDYLPLMTVSNHIRKVLCCIRDCRTEVLGRHLYKCDNPSCSYESIQYNSCRNRNCPKCQGGKRLEWIFKLLKTVLPVKYFHVVFTIPSSLRKLFQYNKKICYSLLFKAVKETLLEVSITNKKLQAHIGFITILHTWTQLLHFHPHIHCIIPAGGISLDKKKWKQCYDNYFLPQKVLSTVFRGKLLSFIEEANKKGKLKYPERTKDKPYLNNIYATLKKASSVTWVIFAKQSFAGPSAVIKYLGNYTHRIALSNKRIVSYVNGKVTFKYKDRKDNNKDKLETLDAKIFLSRYIQHILPERFVKIRYYGILSCANRKEKLKLCHKLILKSGIKIEKGNSLILKEIEEKIIKMKSPDKCPCCNSGLLIGYKKPESLILENLKAG